MKANQTILPPLERLHQPYSPNREESLGEMLKKRSSQIIHLFRDTGHEVTLIGDAEKPVIVLDNKIRLTAYVHNFQLRFVDSPKNGEVIYRVKINSSNHVPKNFLKVFLMEVEQLPVKKKRKRMVKLEKVSLRTKNHRINSIK